MQKSVKMAVTEVNLKMTEDELQMLAIALDFYIVMVRDELEDPEEWEALAESLES